MSKVLRVTIECDDKIITVEGEEAAKWQHHNNAITTFASVHNCNPFDHDKINWTEVYNVESECDTEYHPAGYEGPIEETMSLADALRDAISQDLSQMVADGIITDEAKEGISEGLSEDNTDQLETDLMETIINDTVDQSVNNFFNPNLPTSPYNPTGEVNTKETNQDTFITARFAYDPSTTLIANVDVSSTGINQINSTIDKFKKEIDFNLENTDPLEEVKSKAAPINDNVIINSIAEAATKPAKRGPKPKVNAESTN